MEGLSAQQCEFDDTTYDELNYVNMLRREISYKRNAVKSGRIGFC